MTYANITCLLTLAAATSGCQATIELDEARASASPTQSSDHDAGARATQTDTRDEARSPADAGYTTSAASGEPRTADSGDTHKESTPGPGARDAAVQGHDDPITSPEASDSGATTHTAPDRSPSQGDTSDGNTADTSDGNTADGNPADTSDGNTAQDDTSDATTTPGSDSETSDEEPSPLHSYLPCDVERIVADHCRVCLSSVSPIHPEVPFDTWAQVSSNPWILEEVESGNMPPPEVGRSLNAEQLDTLRSWIQSGAPATRSATPPDCTQP